MQFNFLVYSFISIISKRKASVNKYTFTNVQTLSN